MITNYYRTYARVDIDAIRHNIRVLRGRINDGAKIMAIIKADGYGHGAVPIARELEQMEIDYIAVAIYQEGVKLRKEGIKTPILVLGNTPEEAYEELLNYDLAQTVYSVKMGQDLERVAGSKGKVLKAHVKIDTGMGRLGLQARGHSIDEVVSEISGMARFKHLDVEGVFTHFAKADESVKDYTDMQVELFDMVISKAKALGCVFKYVHASNSAGIIDVPGAHYNMVRAGIAVYGLYPSREVEQNIGLKPALSVVSRIVFIKEVEIGEAISYGGTFITERKTIVATVPVGYADGYSRALSGKGRVVINGEYAPVIGRVCMDMIMVDVTDIKGVKEKDEVYLIGGVDDACIPVEELADIMETINYEVVCLIGKRVPRVYIKENEVVETVDYF